jgi:deazaflavin-dependent oxidoreductase (nitroreductase family)
MSETQNQSAEHLHGPEHVRRYRETGGRVGHRWREGSNTLILTTRGRRSGQTRDNALIYGRHGDDYVVVASRGGSDQHPGWYLNLLKSPDVDVQVMDERFTARARVATPEERPELWALMNREWPHYAEYQTRTDREIPVVVLERV